MAKFNWISFSSIARYAESRSLQHTLPTLLTTYRDTPFTFQDGLSEWKGNGYLCIAEEHDKLLGILRLDEHRTYMGLSSFVVDPSARGLGIGAKMIQQSISFKKPIYLRVKQDNPAQFLYAKHGFTILEATDGRYTMLNKTDF